MRPGKFPLPREDGEYKSWFLWLMAAGMTALLFAVTLLITVPEYMSNDDILILEHILRIPQDGIAAAEGAFSSAVLCALISFFYQHLPGDYWYIIYHGLILFSSLTIIGRCVLGKIRLHRRPLWLGCVIYAVLFVGVFLYSLAEITFTLTAAIAGAAAVAVILSGEDSSARSWRIFCDIAGVVFLLFCWWQRSAAGKCILCFWLLAVCCRLVRLFMRRRDGGLRDALRLSASVLAALALIFGCRALDNRISTDEYSSAEYYRSTIVDYLIDDISAEQCARAGIPQELSTMLHGWYFMDERITTDSLRTLSEIYYADQSAAVKGLPVSARIAAPFANLAQELAGDRNMLCRAALCTVLALLCLPAYFLSGRKFLPELVTALSALGGGVILLIYLVLDGRFLLRVFLTVCYPAVVTILLMLLSFPVKAVPKRPAYAVVSALLGAAAVFFCGMGVCSVPNIAAHREDVFAVQQAIESYANAHEETTFVTNIYDHIFDPFHPLDTYPRNTIRWGSCGDLTRSDRLYADAFFRPDVQFMGESASVTLSLLQYLSVEHGPVQAYTVSQITPSIAAFDISQVTPGKDYTGWYEQNGLTYYFENGEAVTGTHTVDGVEYEFAPAGADSTFFFAQSEDGSTIYSTYAYSLVSHGG